MVSLMGSLAEPQGKLWASGQTQSQRAKTELEGNLIKLFFSFKQEHGYNVLLLGTSFIATFILKQGHSKYHNCEGVYHPRVTGESLYIDTITVFCSCRWALLAKYFYNARKTQTWIKPTITCFWWRKPLNALKRPRFMVDCLRLCVQIFPKSRTY